MWGALIRVGSRYAFFRKWKNIIALGGSVLLCAITAFFIDAEKYLTASIVGLVAVAALISVAMHYWRQYRYNRERERQKLVDAARRAAAAEARGEQFDKMKASAAEMAKGVTGGAADLAKASAAGLASGATGLADAAKTGLSGARDKLGSWRKG